MSASRSAAEKREELLARCRRERAELAGFTGATRARLHSSRELVRALRTVRSLLRLFDSR